jgi:fatty-acyl-CoA synthase
MPAYDYQLLIKRLLLQGVAWAPDQEIVYRDQVRITYRDLYHRILQLGSALRSLGVRPGTRVGVMEWDSHRYLELYFGVPGIGAVLHTINPSLAFEQLLYTIVHADDEVLIFHQDFRPLVERLRQSLPAINKYILLSDHPSEPVLEWETAEYEELLASVTPLPELPDFDENTLATMSYTTGTTGKPKGVCFTERQLTLQTLSDAIALSAMGSYGGVTKHDVYMPLTPMFHGHAWGMPYVATLLGLKQVFPGKYEIPMLLHLLREEKVTFSHCVPTILQTIVSTLANQELVLQGCNVIVGGAALSKTLAREAAKTGVQVYGGYGLSETCPVLTIANLKPFMETWDNETQLNWLTKGGFTIPLVDLKVIDSAGQDVARDGKGIGEVVVRSPWCTQAYAKDQVRSEELWEGGWLHTGDLGTIDEYGYIQIVDRIKDVIKSGGEWIISLELENLLSQCDGILDVAVIGVPNEKWGERPLALVVPGKGYEESLTAEVLKAHLYKYVEEGVLNSWAIPDRYLFVENIPKTSVGKHDKKLLRSRLGDRQ